MNETRGFRRISDNNQKQEKRTLKILKNLDSLNHIGYCDIFKNTRIITTKGRLGLILEVIYRTV